MILPLSLFITLLFATYMQRAHHRFELEKQRKKSADLFKIESDERRKEFEELKKRVDALTLRAGFKT